MVYSFDIALDKLNHSRKEMKKLIKTIHQTRKENFCLVLHNSINFMFYSISHVDKTCNENGGIYFEYELNLKSKLYFDG